MMWGRWIFFFFCFVSFYFGFVTYDGMFPNFGLAMWIFIPDCPLYVALFLLIVLFDIRNDFFRFLTAAGLAKYGLWTLMIFAVYPEVFFSQPYLPQTLILIVGHILMAASSFVIVPKKLGLGIVATVFAWFLLNDFVDYWLGTMPIFPHKHLGFVVLASIGLSILSVFVLYKLRNWRDLGIMEWVRLQLGVSK